MATMILLGNEACAQGALDAGILSAYGYPGTPSTEAVEYIMRTAHDPRGCAAFWCSNEKTAFERAMGVSWAGHRVLVCMKHVGLNVAADAFINASLQKINGGIVVMVADDPGMHSSQNEQDSRCIADFANTFCFEPRNHQEAYAMTVEAFDVSEQFNVPVMIRLVTRLAHSRAVVTPGSSRRGMPLSRPGSMSERMCLPVCARKNYAALLEKQPSFLAYTESTAGNTLELNEDFRTYGVITTGVGENYYREIAGDLPGRAPHLHIGVYPVPVSLVRRLAASVDLLYVIEEGYPYIEGKIRSMIRDPLSIRGKMDRALPDRGELDPETVRALFGLPAPSPSYGVAGGLPERNTQLCSGCPHTDTLKVIREIKKQFSDLVVMADIGCYTLGALPPWGLLDGALCMGASIGMAAGAASAGCRAVIAIIGDSSLFHSGLTGVADAVASDSPIVIIVADNGTVAMTGAQPTILPPDRIESTLIGIGVHREHLRTIVPLPAHHARNVEVVRKELLFKGLSVVIARRECVRIAGRPGEGNGHP
jgi:indolepyruvate ferredoxin oxidoreductase alpha subunit